MVSSSEKTRTLRTLNKTPPPSTSPPTSAWRFQFGGVSLKQIRWNLREEERNTNCVGEIQKPQGALKTNDKDSDPFTFCSQCIGLWTGPAGDLNEKSEFQWAVIHWLSCNALKWWNGSVDQRWSCLLPDCVYIHRLDLSLFYASTTKARELTRCLRHC